MYGKPSINSLQQSAMINNSFLEKCNSIYEDLAGRILKLYEEGKHELALKWIELAAQFSWQAHPGRYADGKIENIAFEIGRNLKQILAEENLNGLTFNVPKLPKSTKRHILHIATTIYDTGGHTRLIYRWIKNDMDSCHSLLLVNQRNARIPNWISETICESGGELISLPSRVPLLIKAKWTREIVSSYVDSVILHHNPNDVVPIVAFATEHSPTVAIMNHADHVFWLGSTVVDVVINFRQFAINLSQNRRFTSHSLLLPIPLNFDFPPQTRERTREQLNIQNGEIVLLSIGAAYKYKPTDSHNFFKTTLKILNQNPAAHLYLIGVEWNQNVEYLKDARHDRLHFLGNMEDPSLYELSADLYLEGFPYGSFTALLETCALGVCPVLMYATTPQLAVSENVGLQGIVENPCDEDEYIKRVNWLIQNPEERRRIANLVKENVNRHHTGSGWQQYLQNIYEYLDRKTHKPGPIPNSDCMETDDDLNLSGFDQVQLGGDPLKAASVGTALASERVQAIVDLQFAYLFFNTGDTPKASRYLLAAFEADPSLSADVKYFNYWLDYHGKEISGFFNNYTLEKKFCFWAVKHLPQIVGESFRGQVVRWQCRKAVFEHYHAKDFWAARAMAIRCLMNYSSNWSNTITLLSIFMETVLGSQVMGKLRYLKRRLVNC